MFRTPPPSQIIIMINLRVCVAAHVFPGHVINHATKLTSKKERPHTMKLFCQLQFSVRSYLDFTPLGIINSFKLVVVWEFVPLSFFYGVGRIFSILEKYVNILLQVTTVSFQNYVSIGNCLVSNVCILLFSNIFFLEKSCTKFQKAKIHGSVFFRSGFITILIS